MKSSLNLILNAVDALPEGGRIEIRAERQKRTVRVVLKDSGTGMDEDTRRRIFEPFFTTKASVGTGLGLSMVYGAITRWGGSIQVESEVERGTSFTIDLPVADRPPEPKLPEEEQVEDLRRGQILIVEDEDHVSGLLERILEKYHETVVFDNGASALAAFRPGVYDVALIDLGLPEIPGDKLAREIRLADPAVSCVLITGWQLAENDVRLDPFDFHIQKPFRKASQIRRIMSRALSLSHERRHQTP